MRASSLALVPFLALPSLAGSVRVVGGIHATDPTIQSAVNASADGDIVLVRDSSSPGFVVDGKSLTIVGESPSLGVQGPIEIRNLAATQTCVVRSLSVSLEDTMLLHVRDCAGHVRIEEFHAIGTNNVIAGLSAVLVENSADVAVAHSMFGGHLGSLADSASVGLTIRDSSVRLDQSTVIGGGGGFFFIPPNFNIGGAGADAIRLEGSATLAMQSADVVGGPRGNGLCLSSTPNGPGSGIRSNSATTVQSIASTVSAGSPGFGGGAGCGAPPALVNVTLQVPPVEACVLACPGVVRELGTLSIDVRGAPGETATLLVSTRAQLTTVPTVVGSLLVGPNLRRLALGIIPASGTLSVALPMSALSPGTQGTRVFLQAFARTATTPVHTSGASSVAWIDASL